MAPQQGLLTGSELFVAIALASMVVCLGAWNIDDRIPTRSAITSENEQVAPILPLLLTAFAILFIERPHLLDAIATQRSSR